MTDLYHLWKEEYDQVSRNAGCILNCMTKELNLFDGEGRVHHGNAKDFVLSNGGDEKVANQMVSLVHDCEKQQEAEADECEHALKLAKCIRTGIRQVQWAPKMEVVITEIVEEAG
nr:odorant-binding protein 8 [Diaphania glauculalis]